MNIFTAFKFYSRYMFSFRRNIIKMAVIFPFKHVTILIIPLMVKFIIDDFIPEGNLVFIYGTIGVIALAGLINFILHPWYVTMETEITKGVSRQLRNLLINKLQILNLQYHIKNGAGTQYSKIMVDVEKTERFSQIVFQDFSGSGFTLVFSFVVLSMVNIYITGIFLLFVPIYWLIYRFFRNRFTILQKNARMANENLSRALSRFSQINFLTRIHGVEDYERTRIDRENVRIINENKNVFRLAARFSLAAFVLSEIFLVLIVAVSAHAVVAGVMQVGSIIMFLTYIRSIITSGNQIMNKFPDITAFSEAIFSIREILNSPHEEQNAGKTEMGPFQGEIKFKQVSFSYGESEVLQDKKSVFNNISTMIKPGQTIALVGPSGSGKTTFVNLVIGLIQPVTGEVLLDGQSIADIDMRTFRRQVGVVTQTPVIFRGSVYENIAYGKENFDPLEVEDAARKANAHSFISEMPEGYNSDLGEEGGRLSGGQKQRIAIARSIFRKPRLLILDEATSALDPHAEIEVQKGIDSLLGNQTTLVIAHRLSTIFHADSILVFSDGKIVEQGRHNDLIDANGRYADLLMTQMNLSRKNLENLKR